ncbi:MAG: hypothetical protein WBW71_05505 [Bacteroidota bacterium]
MNDRLEITLLSLAPEKEAKSRCTGSRLSYFWKAGRASRNRNAGDAFPHTAGRKRFPLATCTCQPFSQRTHRSHATAADSEDTAHATFATLIEIVKSADGKDSIEGFQFRRLTIKPQYSTLSCAEIDGMCGWD